MFYRTKQVTIAAVQWRGDNLNEVKGFMEGANYSYAPDDDSLYIETLEGTMKASKDDYIIRGLKGEYYPCKPDIFNQKYEPIGLVEALMGI